MKSIILRANEVRQLQTGEVLVVRKVKDQPVPASALSRASPARLLVSDDDWVAECRSGSSGYVYTWPKLGPVNDRFVSEQCPLGKPTERRWVRETWNTTHISDLAPGETIGKSGEDCARDNDGFACACGDGVVYGADGVTKHPEFGKALWRSSATMPRWASRYVVEIAEVQARQVQAITEAEAIAAGVPEPVNGHAIRGALIGRGPSYREGFAQRFEDECGEGSWNANPWAWFLMARRVEV